MKMLMKLLKSRPIVMTVLALIASFSFLSSAHGQGSLWGNIMSYDSRYQWILFNDQTGTWHAPLAIHNSAAPSNSITEFSVNTDNQFEIQTFNQGNIASILDLDTDGSAALWGAGGGGIGVEAATGDTCLPSVQTAPCSPYALRMGANGILNHYRGQALAGNGISTLQYVADATLTSGFGPYTIFTANTSGYASGGMYRLTGYLTSTANAPGASMQFVAGYVDETGPQTQTASQQNFSVPGANLPFSFVFYSQPGTAISITTVNPGNSTYTIHLRLEAL
jgi:hypothetical protein